MYGVGQGEMSEGLGTRKAVVRGGVAIVMNITKVMHLRVNVCRQHTHLDGQNLLDYRNKKKNPLRLPMNIPWKMKNQKPALTFALFLPDICMNIIRTCSMGVSVYVCRLSLYTPIHKYNHTSYFLSSLSCLSSPLRPFRKRLLQKKKNILTKHFRLEQGVSGVDFGESFGHEDFHTSSFVI